MLPSTRVDYHRLAVLTRHLDSAERTFVNDAACRHRLLRLVCAGFRPALRDGLEARATDPEALLGEVPESWWFDSSRLRVVATGFGPFLDHARNPSWEAARAFAEVVGADYQTACDELAVTYEAARGFADETALHDGQVIVVHFGLAASAQKVRVERYAHNCRGAKPDESGRRDWPDWLAADGPAALETLLDVGALVASCAEIGAELPEVGVSRDPGDYVCNAIYYHSLAAVDAARRADRAAEALFVHVPPVDSVQARRLGAAIGEGMRAHLSRELGISTLDA